MRLALHSFSALLQRYQRGLRPVDALRTTRGVVREEQDRHAVRALGTNLRYTRRHDATAAVPVEEILLVAVPLEQWLTQARASIRDQPDRNEHVIPPGVEDLSHRQYRGSVGDVRTILATSVRRG